MALGRLCEHNRRAEQKFLLILIRRFFCEGSPLVWLVKKKGLVAEVENKRAYLERNAIRPKVSETEGLPNQGGLLTEEIVSERKDER